MHNISIKRAHAGKYGAHDVGTIAEIAPVEEHSFWSELSGKGRAKVPVIRDYGSFF